MTADNADIARIAALAIAVQRSALLPQEEQAALLDRYRRLREHVLRTGTAETVQRLLEIDEASGPLRPRKAATLTVL
ncbi:hypothetical protein [Glycomyces sp. NPDC048151]|uniref:hypothetical protein n=1 Tax=Glycomyces sp. NPDC048151 TaxID=3364002 RepID=UPI00371FF0F8